MQATVRKPGRSAALACGFAAMVTLTAASGAQAAPRDAKACQRGGWETLYTATGDPFASGRECTGYAAQGGTLYSTPYTVAEDLCEGAGGVFDTPFGFVWRCTQFSIGASFSTGEATGQALARECLSSEAGEQASLVVNGDPVYESAVTCMD